MPQVFKSLVNISVWMLFLKGLLAVAITLYAAFRGLIADGSVPEMAVAGCAAGSFAFFLACAAAWIRHKMG